MQRPHHEQSFDVLLSPTTCEQLTDHFQEWQISANNCTCTKTYLHSKATIANHTAGHRVHTGGMVWASHMGYVVQAVQELGTELKDISKRRAAVCAIALSAHPALPHL